MPPATRTKYKILQEEIAKNRNYIKQINTKFGEKLEQQERKDRQRDLRIGEIRQNLDQLGNFVKEKLSNHPNDFENFVRHQSNQGGRRKTRKRKKRRKSRKMRKKTKRRRKKSRKKK